jgi:hypothetical protein
MLEDVYATVGRHAAALGDDGLGRPSRAEGWSVKALLFHQLLDAQRALVALATPAEGPADVDAVSYWRPFRPGADDRTDAAARRHGVFVARVAGAYDGSRGLLAQWDHTSSAVVRAVAAADPGALVETQGHVLTVADLASTLVVEATVHLLDAHGEPPAAAVAHTLEVLAELHGGPLPQPAAVRADGAAAHGLAPEVEALLQATGRLPSRHPAYPLLG